MGIVCLAVFSYGLTNTRFRYGIDIEVPGASILSSFGFKNTALRQDIISLAIFGGTSNVLIGDQSVREC